MFHHFLNCLLLHLHQSLLYSSFFLFLLLSFICFHWFLLSCQINFSSSSASEPSSVNCGFTFSRCSGKVQSVMFQLSTQLPSYAIMLKPGVGATPPKNVVISCFNKNFNTFHIYSMYTGRCKFM